VPRVSFDDVREAYSARAAEYVDAVGRIEHATQQDRDDVLAWAHAVDGPVLDVGCGPGQWTDLLHREGVDVVGVDPVEVFVERASSTYPAARYRVGRAEDLGVADKSLGGILAWFSLIHTEPRLIDVPLAEFSRCLRAGGSLALGFFVGPDREPFAHAVATAYTWTVEGLGEVVERAGFTVVDARSREEPGGRPGGMLVAERRRRATASRAPARRGSARSR